MPGTDVKTNDGHQLIKTSLRKTRHQPIVPDRRIEIDVKGEAGEQRVTVFDSSATAEPFMDTNELEALKKRQQAIYKNKDK